MSYDEQLVGALSIILSVLATLIATGHWDAPYQLRTISAVSRRYGKSAARCVWIAIAIASFAAGIAIINGVRPPYAVPAHQSSLEQ